MGYGECDEGGRCGKLSPPPDADADSPRTDMMVTAAVGTHYTGMHSYCRLIYNIKDYQW